MLFVEREVFLWHFDCDSFRDAEPLIFHIFNHSDNSLERWTLNWVAIVSHYLPTFPCAQSALDAEGDIL